MRDHELEAKLNCIEWPPSVVRWKVEKGTDATGEEAVWVWITLDSEKTDKTMRFQLRDRVRAVVMKFEDPAPYWVYVRFVGEPELEAQ